MQKTKGNLAFAEKYKLVQWLGQSLASLGGRTYESIAQEATKALGYHISDNVLENINPRIHPGPYNPWNNQRLEVTCADQSIKSMFKGDESSHAQAAIPSIQ